MDCSADGDQTSAPANDACGIKIEKPRNLAHKCRQVWFDPLRTGESNLRHSDAWNDPCDISGRELRIEKAVQPVRIDIVHAFVLGFHSRQEALVRTQREIARVIPG